MDGGGIRPLLLPIGDRALLVRFADTLSEDANRAAIALARQLDTNPPEGVEEIAPGLVSVLLRLRPGIDFIRLCGEIRLLMTSPAPAPVGASHVVDITFDGEDLPEVASLTGLAVDEFVERHNRAPLRVLATGFAPGFVYCGFHADELIVPRRERVRPMVQAGTVLFAAGQTAIAATPIRTGWHVIGRTTFQNFDAQAAPPTRLAAGDDISFVVLP